MALAKFRLLLLLVSCSTWAAVGADETSIFQIRRVVNAPAANVERMPFTSPDGQTMMLTVEKTPLLDLSDVESATVESKDTPSGEPEMRVMLTPHGRERLGEVTSQAIHQRIAVVIDGKVWQAPVIQAR